MIEVYSFESFDLRVCYASQIGLYKTENQDSLKTCFNGQGLSVSVCDGLGSAAFSKEGSEKAAELLSEAVLKENFDKEEFAKNWLSFFQNDPSSYNTTAKFICIKQNQLIFGGVGDGIIAIKNDDVYSIYYQHGDFSNQTSCVYDPFFKESFSLEKLQIGQKAIVLISTDGFSEDINEDGIKGLIREAEKSDLDEEFDSELLSLLANWPNKTNADDKTVAFVRVKRK